MKVTRKETGPNVNRATTAPACIRASSAVGPHRRYRRSAEPYNTASNMPVSYRSPPNEFCLTHQHARKISNSILVLHFSVLGMGIYPNTSQCLSEEPLTKYLLTCPGNNFPGISAGGVKISFAPLHKFPI